MPPSKYRYLIDKKKRPTLDSEMEAERLGVTMEEFEAWCKVERAKKAWVAKRLKTPQGEV